MHRFRARETAAGTEAAVFPLPLHNSIPPRVGVAARTRPGLPAAHTPPALGSAQEWRKGEATRESGNLSYAKVRALTRVATPETEAKLLDAAMYSTGAQLERLCRGYRAAMTADNVLPPPERSVRRRNLPGGMVKLEVILSPDEAALVLTALDRAREVPHERSAARPATAASWPRATTMAEQHCPLAAAPAPFPLPSAVPSSCATAAAPSPAAPTTDSSTATTSSTGYTGAKPA
jgi:hypothetical protein